MSVQPITKINAMKGMWYVYIPKLIQNRLERLGVQKDDVVMWEGPIEENGKVIVVMKIVKGVKKSAIRI